MSDISEGPLTQAEMPYRLDCIVMDTETTGFRVDEGHRLIEVATVEVEDWQVEPIGWATLVKPLREIPPGATLVHKITDEMVEDAPLPVDVGVGLRFRIGDTALAFHNANFDLPFLQQFFSDAGAPAITNPVIDTLGLARGIYGTGGNALEKLCERLGVKRETAHRALGDAMMTAKVLTLMARWYSRHKGINTLAELAALSQDIVRTTGRGHHR